MLQHTKTGKDIQSATTNTPHMLFLFYRVTSDTTTKTRQSRSFLLITPLLSEETTICPLEVIDPVTIYLANLIWAFPFLIRSLSTSLYRVGQSLGPDSQMIAFGMRKSCNETISRCSHRLFGIGS